MASNEEFELQLRLEAEEAERNSHPVKESDNPLLRRDPNDGTLYEYDLIRKGWFPKIDDDFIAMYQASYGVTKSDESNDSGIKPESFLNSTTSKDVATQDDDQSITQNGEKLESPIQAADPLHAATKRSVPDQTQPSGSDSKRAKKSASAAPAEWFEMQDEHNRNVYVSNLPEELEEQEFVELMSKCGMVMKDPSTNRFKVKLYRDSNGHLKGDALCTYIKIESVQLAEQILDGSLFKDREIKVEKAKFQLKGQYDPTKKPRKLKAKDKQKMKQKLQNLYSWKPDKLPGERPRREKVVILKNIFDPADFEKDATLILEYRAEVMEECESECGSVRKVELYDRNPEGVIAVFFNDFEAADKCVELMNGRWFAKRQLVALHWDGRTRYKVQESEEEAEKRIAEWNRYLEQS